MPFTLTLHISAILSHIRTNSASQVPEQGRRDRELSLSTDTEVEEAAALCIRERLELPKQQVIEKAAFSATWV